METKETMSKKTAREQYQAMGGRLKDENVKAFVVLRDVDKVYPNGVKAVHHFSLELEEHDFVAFVGPSGCGKTTTLRMIAGLEEITAGELYIDKTFSNFVPSKDRDIAMVFQSYALYPQLTVFENIAFGLKIQKINKKEIEERVFQAANILDLGGLLDRRPKELSGGQMQRVALGRAIVRKAKLFLMDEPLSNLDAKLRVSMRSEIVRIHEEVKATTIYVTHDQTEAMTMANKIVVMNKGFIEQVGKPMDIYHHPRTIFVATFIGSPAMNMMQATYHKGKLLFENGYTIAISKAMKEDHDRFYQAMISRYRHHLQALTNYSEIDANTILNEILAHTNEKTQPIVFKQKKQKFSLFARKKIVTISAKDKLKLRLDEGIAFFTKALTEAHNVLIGIRPEHLVWDQKQQRKSTEVFSLKADLVEILGSEYIVHGRQFSTDITMKQDARTPILPHQELHLAFEEDKLHVFDSISGFHWSEWDTL